MQLAKFPPVGSRVHVYFAGAECIYTVCIYLMIAHVWLIPTTLLSSKRQPLGIGTFLRPSGDISHPAVNKTFPSSSV